MNQLEVGYISRDAYKPRKHGLGSHMGIAHGSVSACKGIG